MRSDGQLLGYVRTVIDVTFEREERERLIASSRARVDLVFILKADPAHAGGLRFEYANDRAKDFVGHEAEGQAPGTMDVFAGESAEAFRALLREVLVSGIAAEKDMVSPIDSSEKRRISFRVVPLPGGLVVAGRFLD
jgi:hypothetical protein